MKILGLILIFVLILLLFVSGPDHYEDRLFKEFWETGHFILFASLVFILLHFKIFKSVKWIHLLWITAIFSITTGLAIEVLQLFVGRSFSLKDVANDVVGGFAGLLLSQLFSLIKTDPPPPKRTLVTRGSYYVVGFLLLSLLGSRTLIMILIDEWELRSSFPVLSDFESSFQTNRWSGFSAYLIRSNQYSRSGGFSMKSDFYPNRYSDITLESFNGDWSTHQKLNFSLFNPQPHKIEMIVKVFDEKHSDRGYRYADRFNKEITVNPGWNDFSILIADIKNAPSNRQMELESIYSFSLFTIDLKKTVTIYLDDLFLSKS